MNKMGQSDVAGASYKRGQWNATMTKPVLYGFPASTFSQTAALALVEKGVNFEMVSPDLEQLDYRTLHPFSKVPVLRHGNVTVCETLAIATYVDENFPGPSLQPTGIARYQHIEWISFYLDYFVAAILNASVRERFVRPIFGGVVDKEAVSRAIPDMTRCIEVLRDRLSRNHFVAGDQIGIADFLFVPTILYFSQTPEGKKLLGTAHSVGEWVNVMKRRPSVRTVCMSQA